MSSYDFLNLYGRFCPYNPPYKPKSKISTCPVSQIWEHFPKTVRNCNRNCTMKPYFWKILSSSRKGGCWCFRKRPLVYKQRHSTSTQLHFSAYHHSNHTKPMLVLMSWWFLRHDPARTAPWPLGWVKTISKIVRSHAYSTTWLGKKCRLFIYRDFSTNGCLGKH
jgi:hypothetical protein